MLKRVESQSWKIIFEKELDGDNNNRQQKHVLAGFKFVSVYLTANHVKMTERIFMKFGMGIV